MNYYEKEVNTEEDNNPIGIVLCAEKDEIVAEYSLEGLNNNIFASQYTYCIPDKEQLIKEKSEIEKEMELIKNIIKTREELKSDNKNFEFAEQELVDYYIYHIKANQAKLDYLIKLAKANGITIDIINQIKYEKYDEETG